MSVFAGIKIEKVLVLPPSPKAGQFYLLETGTITQFYLSDSQARLHLLNEASASIVDYEDDVVLTSADTGAIVVDNDSVGVKTVFLPSVVNGLEYEFWVFHGNGLSIVSTGDEPIMYEAESEDILESTDAMSTARIYGYNGAWVVRFATGTWSLYPSEESS